MKILYTALLGAACMSLTFSPSIAQAQGLLDVEIAEPGGSGVTRQIIIGLNKSTVIDFDNPAADVFITNPEIADAAVQTDKRMVFRGVQVGQTNAFVFDAAGNQMLNLEIRVEPDVAALAELIDRHVPNARIKAEAINSNILLTGLVDNLGQSDAVLRIANAYLDTGGGQESEIINMMEIAAKDQVLLQVRVVEMQRSLVKQLGVNLGANLETGLVAGNNLNPALLQSEGIIEAATTQGFNVAGAALGGFNATGDFFGEEGSVNASLQALERIGVVRTLAEPNITSLSGEPARFLSGGEFPVPVAQGNDGAISVQFRPFGVGVGFTPIVLSEGRISLRLSTEVSDLTSVGAFTGAPIFIPDATGNLTATAGLTIPALSVRRAETTVELPSGQSMMIAGLIESGSSQSIDNVPGLKNVPVLGALFRSRDFQNEETELVIIVTPYLVDPTSQRNLRTPDKGFANPSDAKAFFFGKLNRLYGKGEKPADFTNYRAPVGFIEE